MPRDNTSSVERRRNPRYKINDGAVIFSMGNHTGIGKIVDISTDGMGFEYNSFRNNSQHTPAMLNIFVNKDNFYLNEIPGTVVSDVRLQNRRSQNASSGAPERKRCSVVFQGMAPLHSRRLIHFLDMQASEIVMDAETALTDSQISRRRCRSISETLDEGYFEMDLDGHILFFNNAMRKLTGYNANVLAGLNVGELMDGESRSKVFRLFKKARKRKMPPSVFDWELKKKDGTVLTVETSCSLIKDADERVEGLRIIVRDMENGLTEESELLRMVTRDPISGLLNKEAFLDHLEEMLRYAKRYDNAFSIIYMDMEDIETIRELYGPSAGHYLLKRIGTIMRSRLRETDFACRYHKNEFFILLSDPSRTAPEFVVEKMMRYISGPHQIDGETIDLMTARVGVSTYPEDGTDATALIISAKSSLQSHPLKYQ